MAEVVTSENLREFNLSRLIPAPEVQDVEVKEVDPAPEVKEEPKEEEHHEEATKKRNKLEERFSELTRQRNEARERAEAAERRAAELEAKSKPAEKIDADVGPEPKSTDYTDAFEYAKDLAKWSTDKALKDRDAKEAEKAAQAEREKTTKAWTARLEAVKTELPDYVEVVASAEDLSVSDDVRDAIIESEIGPRIIYHLAKNPDLVESINGMTVRGALRQIGKLEALLEKPKEDKPQEKPVALPKVRPPEPITPIRATNTPDNRVGSDGEFTGTYAQWKALRQAKKI